MLGVDVTQLRTIVQGAGRALRMSARQFSRELQQSPALEATLKRYVYVLMSQLAQLAACTHFHVSEARLARWLLMTRDRAHSDTFYITQEFLAYMLGVRRVGITNAAGALQKRRLIRYARGSMTILDRRAGGHLLRVLRGGQSDVRRSHELGELPRLTVSHRSIYLR